MALSFNSASAHSSVLMSLPPSTTVTHQCMHTKDVVTTNTINDYNGEEFVFYSPWELTLSMGLSFNSASAHSSVLMSLPPSTTVTHQCMHTKDVVTTNTINDYNGEEFVFYSPWEYGAKTNSIIDYHTNQNDSLLPPERMYSLLCLALRESIALR
ncbi:hypothetical protein ZEAMMB73_Zm00001d048906 [Zea mays]|uniref:Uncharacterized protein n=2 Tax=Zea mays TaxID=4577 RepID=A0A1D6PR42_MAIZE|nr:hypothetical protein ZEAMMB73_Zm00001d048906 [Zea mays]